MRLLMLLLLLAWPFTAQAGLADVVARVMPSVVSLEKDGKAYCTGVILNTAKRHVLTARHCVQGSTFTIGLSDGRTVSARLVGVASIDIAILQIIEPVLLPAVQLGNASALRAGDAVFVVGHPLGYRYTVTAGIVSFVGRDDGDPSGLHIQVDAVIHPGNSGGPLFDFDGRLLGINDSAIQPPGRGHGIGLGFSIPMDAVLVAVAEIERL
ncbi:MAG: trypsin-like peptidase domain-containing protein [Methylibium sp.]|uniref:S1C family serine protease n=1 Tax=Methylibium sp. TaxID=2067992 RepID=UPI001802C82F|nr:trypsin-like peptidase domain-containing protein [Methylibium sp.]MBA3599539.1 trypsin-like peptidase domain-containing protein [Methylibium sp.]